MHTICNVEEHNFAKYYLNILNKKNWIILLLKSYSLLKIIQSECGLGINIFRVSLQLLMNPDVYVKLLINHMYVVRITIDKY